jgi:multidrug efflux system membrane fusion protein
VAAGCLLVALLAWLFLINRKPAAKPAPPGVPVTLAKATVRDFPLTITSLGAAQAWQSVTINPQVSGRLTYVANEGDYVKAGALLVKIDCAPYQAALKQAEGNLKRDQAVLAGARTDLARYETLVSQNSIAKQTADDEAATVKQDEGTVLADQGAVDSASVNVRFCGIPSPVAGRVGVRLVDPGNIVSAGMTTGIITVVQIQPIAVTFDLPQRSFQSLKQASANFTQPLATEAFSQDNGQYLGSGELQVADNHVDPTTGTVEMKAKFPNAASLLWPGQFINVKLTLQVLPRVTTIPSAAVNQGPDGAYAYVVGPNSKVEQRPINVLATQDDLAVIKSGVAPGETVVTDGQMSLKPGLAVVAGGAPSKKPAA